MSKYVYFNSRITEAGVLQPSRPNNTTQLSLLNGIPEGYGESHRVGREISLSKMEIIADVQSGNATDDVRLLVFYVRHQNGLPVDINTFMKPNNFVNFPSSVCAFNELNRHRFEVLLDVSVNLYSNERLFQRTVDLTGKKTYYSGATEFNDHVRDGTIYSLFITTSSSSSIAMAGVLYYNDK